jgi:homoserine O-acetyltransferase
MDLETFMKEFWEHWACSKGDAISHCLDVHFETVAHIERPDPENMLAMLQTWQSGDCSKQEPYNGNFELAMQSIKAKTLVMPARTDLYFP